MKKLILIVILLLSITSIFSSCKRKSNNQSSYSHYCGHCGKGFNGDGYLKDSGGNAYSVSSSEVENYPAHYCSESCALLD